MSDHFVRHMLTSGGTVKTEFECRAEAGASCRSACECYDKEYEICESPGGGADEHPRTDRGECLQIPFFTEGDPEYSYDGPDRPVRGPGWQPIILEWQGDYYTWDYADQQPGDDSNRFKDAENATELIHQIVGAGSVCWENPGGAGTFDDGAARQVADAGLERLGELIRAAGYK